MRAYPFAGYVISILLWMCLLPSEQLFSSETTSESRYGLDQVLANVKERERSLKTFTAKFQQTKKTPLLRELLQSEGWIYFDHSGKILFDITGPSASLVLLEDGMVTVHHPGFTRAEKAFAGSDVLKKYFGIGMSPEELKQEYEIELLPTNGLESYRIKLTPKSNALSKHVNSIEIKVPSKSWLPEQIYVEQSKENWISLNLQFVSINEPLPPEIFKINVPEDEPDY